MGDKMKQMNRGFRSLFVGLGLVRSNPKILRLAIIPLLLNFFILLGVFVWGTGRISGWVDQGLGWLIDEPSGFFGQLIYWPLFLLGWLAFLAGLFFLGYILASLIASPFNSLLAETTLEEQKVIQHRPFQLKRWIDISLRMLWAGLLKTGVFLLFGLMFFVMSFVPILGFVASFGILLIMAFDCADYSFEILEFNLQQRFRFFRENSFLFIGAGAALGLTLLVPGLNFLLFPAAVVGSADLVGRQLSAKVE